MLFYVHTFENGGKTIRKTELIRKAGTWHYYRDEYDGREWHSRGPKAYDTTHAATYADACNLADSREQADLFYDLIDAARCHGYGEGVESGKTLQRNRCGCDLPCLAPVPKPRSFIRRLLSGHPFAAV